MSDHKLIAQTILSQLGGGRLAAMTGARNFLSHEAKDGSRGALSFQLPARFAKDGINYVKVKLMGSDTYTVEFVKIGPSPSLKGLIAGKTQKITTVAVREDIYAEQLKSVVASVTGLALSL